jgi:hypothetical protein
MQDMIARYSRELLDYGRQHGSRPSGAPQAAAQGTQTAQTARQSAAAEEVSEAAYAGQAPQQETPAQAAVQETPVLYEDLQSAGNAENNASGRIIFGTGSRSTAAPPRPAQEQWTPTRAAAESTPPKQTRPAAPAEPAETGTQRQTLSAATGTAAAQNTGMAVNNRRTARQTQQRALNGAAAGASLPPAHGDPLKTSQSRIFARLEDEIVPLRPDDDSLGQGYTAAMSAGQNLPDLNTDTGEVLGFSSGDLLQLQNMNADRVQNIDVSSLIAAADGRGWLKVHVFASEARFPLSNARVVVFQTMNGKNYVIYDKLTDSNGVVEDMVLPAPRKEYSLSPNGVSGKHSIPYSTYNLYVDHPGFLRKSYPEISVFDGVDSIKPVILTPKTMGMANIPAINFYNKAAT